MLSKLLTISIPTWNRAALLKDLLAEITLFISSLNLENEIELLVSNNNSDDDTEEIVKEFKAKFSFINYYRNPVNIGAKSNVLQSMYRAAGEFVLFIGDDDRINKDALKKIVTEIKQKKDAAVFIDNALAKKKDILPGKIELENLLTYFYWHIGNAGYFIIRSNYIRQYIDKYDEKFFNECWPQTQLIILSLAFNKNEKCYLSGFELHAPGSHNDVMLYNSFYLWRTCYYELFVSIEDIAQFIEPVYVSAAKRYLKSSLIQQLFNILQCGIFVDDQEQKKKTRKHIVKHLSMFTFYERFILSIVSIALFLPSFLSKPLSNLSIFLIKGSSGLKKKNEFAVKERSKRINHEKSLAGSVRTLEFEVDN